MLSKAMLEAIFIAFTYRCAENELFLFFQSPDALPA
jgi:hypothetical protein